MKPTSSLLLTVTCLAAVLVPAPALAAGERCRTSASVERCAEMTTVSTDDENFYASGYVGSLRYPRIKVRWVWVAMQHRTADGWQTVARHTNLNDDRMRSYLATAFLPCQGTPGGVYRSRSKAEWKVRGEDRVHTATVTSSGVRKARLCD